MSERIMTLHPDGKAGVNIRKQQYDTIKEAILAVISERGEVFFKELPTAVDEQLNHNFGGSISWYVTTVKLDLEARNIIERIPKSSPQRLRLVG